MKRGFLFGLSWFLFASVLMFFSEALKGATPAPWWVWIIAALIVGAIGIKVIRRAKQAPPHASRLQAVMGWLAGFCSINVAVLVLAAGIAIYLH
ncbi:MAG: hypothetical protein J0H78_18970 [Rhizobiales bacterium]|nr:hypothetical protein [Hyphomicrobiales bacterium]